MLLTKTVKVKWHSTTKKFYVDKGYVFTNYRDEFEIKVEDLQDYSCFKGDNYFKMVEGMEAID